MGIVGEDLGFELTGENPEGEICYVKFFGEPIYAMNFDHPDREI